MSWNCPENKITNKRGAYIANAKEESLSTKEKEETPERGESLMLERVLVQAEK